MKETLQNSNFSQLTSVTRSRFWILRFCTVRNFESTQKLGTVYYFNWNIKLSQTKKKCPRPRKTFPSTKTEIYICEQKKCAKIKTTNLMPSLVNTSRNKKINCLLIFRWRCYRCSENQKTPPKQKVQVLKWKWQKETWNK